MRKRTSKEFRQRTWLRIHEKRRWCRLGDEEGGTAYDSDGEKECKGEG